MALVVTDASMVNVALPTISEALNVTAAKSVLVVSAYQTTLLMFLLPMAAIGQAFGYRRVFSAGLLIFASAAVLSAWAPSLHWLVAARIIQGIGAAAIMALGIALLRQSLPQSRFGSAIGWNALTVALCSAAGPAIAAVLLSVASWHWLFLVHLPLALVALLCSRAFPAVRGAGGRLDLVSMGMSMAAFALLLLGIGSFGSEPHRACAMIIAAGVGFWMLARREMGRPSPVVPIDLLRQRGFRLSVIASVCCFIGQTSGMVALPFYLQQVLGLSPLMTGLFMTPWPMAVAASALYSGRLADRWPSAPLTVAGAALLALGLGGAALASPGAAPRTIALFTILCGLGFGLFQVPNNRNMFLGAPADRSGAAGGLQGTARLTGQAVGATIIALLFETTSGAAAPELALTVGAAFAIAASAVSAWQSLARGRADGRIRFDSETTLYQRAIGEGER
jgi:DHA2 family multidrug resistance protein-like MFS transporter